MVRSGFSPRGNVVPLAVGNTRVNSGPARSPWIPRLRNLLLFGCILWALWVYVFVQLPTLNKLEREKLELSHQLSSIQQDKSALEQDVANYQNDSFIERIVRRDYNMVKPGDVIFQPGK